jgi:membrane protease YdiL (CAAX protease family)
MAKHEERTGIDVSQDTPTDRPDRDDDTEGELSLGPVPFALLVLFEAGLAPLSLLVGLIVRSHPLTTFAWDADAAFNGVLAAIPMVAMFAAILRWPVGPLRGIKEYFDDELAPALSGCEWPDLAVLSVAAAVGEEMLFRGVIQGALSRLLGPAAGVVLASVVFGLLHPVSLSYMTVAALLGACLGVVWLISGNLLTVMVAHALYDFVALAVLHHMRSTADESEPAA